MDLLTTLRQDFRAFSLAFEGEEARADLAVVFANRFLSNLLLLDQRGVYVVLGFGLRVSATDNLKATQLKGTPKESIEAKNTIKEATRDWVSFVEEQLNQSGPLNAIAVWQRLHAYVNATRKAFLTIPEAMAYKDNEAATGIAINYLYLYIWRPDWR